MPKWMVWLVKSTVITGAGLLLAFKALPLTFATGWMVVTKVRGRAPECSWRRTFSIFDDAERFNVLESAMGKKLAAQTYDPALDIELISSPRRPFWISRGTGPRAGRNLLGYLLAEQDWIAEKNRGNVVRRGDIVFDCGAHVGVFTHKALELGASKVVAIEPHPVNLECLRRNFVAEIAAGKVIVVAKGVWSSEKTINLFPEAENSGMGTMVHQTKGTAIEVPVTTIDSLVAALNLPRVDYIKMDIEGAEREALKGGLQTLRRFRPRLMLDSYHEPDDMKVLPSIIRQAHPQYRSACGPCQPSDYSQSFFVPHTIFFE